MHLPEWNIYFLFLLSFTNIDRDISQAGFFSRRRQPTEVKIQKKTKEKKKRETQDTNKEDEEEEKKPSATRGESWTQFSLSKMGSSPSLVWRPKPRPPFSFVLFFPLRRCFICLSVSSFSSASFSVFLSIASLLFLSSQFGNKKKETKYFRRPFFGGHLLFIFLVFPGATHFRIRARLDSFTDRSEFVLYLLDGAFVIFILDWANKNGTGFSAISRKIKTALVLPVVLHLMFLFQTNFNLTLKIGPKFISYSCSL